MNAPLWLFVLLLLLSMWVGGVIVLIILAYIDAKDKAKEEKDKSSKNELSSTISVFRFWWYSKELDQGRGWRLFISIAIWALYHFVLLDAFAGSLKESRKYRKIHETDWGMNTVVDTDEVIRHREEERVRV